MPCAKDGLPWATGWQINLNLSTNAVALRLVTLSRDFRFSYGLALTRGQGEQDILILSRIVDVLVEVTLSRATPIFFRLSGGQCPKGLPWVTGWQIKIIRTTIAVFLRLVSLFRDPRFLKGLALTQGQGEQDIIIMSRIVDLQVKESLSRATPIFFRLGCGLCPRSLPWITGWTSVLILSTIAVVLRLVTLSGVFFFVLQTCPDSRSGRTRHYRSV